VSGSGINWAVRKSAPRSRQPHQHSTAQFFTGRMLFLNSVEALKAQALKALINSNNNNNNNHIYIVLYVVTLEVLEAGHSKLVV